MLLLGGAKPTAGGKSRPAVPVCAFPRVQVHKLSVHRVSTSFFAETSCSCLLLPPHPCEAGDALRPGVATSTPTGSTFVACTHSCRRDECERVKQLGARVLTLEQVEGFKDPEVQCWGTEEEDGGDPPRLWSPNGQYPGTAFTRSIGDSGGWHGVRAEVLVCSFQRSCLTREAVPQLGGKRLTHLSEFTVSPMRHPLQGGVKGSQATSR